MAAPESLTRLTMTAIGMARIRADESRRPDQLFDDPLAAAFVAAAPELPPRGGPAAGRSARSARGWPSRA